MNLVMLLLTIVAYTTFQVADVLGYTTSTASSVISGNTRSNNPNHTSKSSAKAPDSHPNPIPLKIPWLIVGGGIHGVHIASRLLGSGTTPPNSVRIIDGSPQLLQKWKSRTAATGMKYLRSSASFHLDLEDYSLKQMFDEEGMIFDRIDGESASKKRHDKKRKKKRKKKDEQTGGVSPAFANDYDRPRLDVFNQHCDYVIKKYKLNQAHTQGFVTGIDPNDEYVRVKITLPDATDIIYEADQIVLALGNDDPSYADWVDEDDVESGLVRHLLDINDNEDKDRINGQKSTADFSNVGIKARIAIVGGGITAAHKALELVREMNLAKTQCCTPPSIHLISRHPIKEQQFDTGQDWMMDRAASERSVKAGGSGMPICQIGFSSCKCLKERRKIISQERVPGTVTTAVNRGKDGLMYAIKSGAVQWHQSEIVQKNYKYMIDDNNSDSNYGDHLKQNQGKFCGIELTLSCGETILVDKILLATGFGKKLPGGAMIQHDLVDRADLPVSAFCGFPVINENLQWHKRIFVAGAMADLELGPSARNIAGARLAAERILQSQK